MDSFSHLQLPGFVIAGLYADSLVMTDMHDVSNEGVKGSKLVDTNVNSPLKEEKTQVQTEKYWFGNNQKGVIVLVNDPTSMYLNDNDMAFLAKILQACHLSMDDIAIINVASRMINVEELQVQLTMHYLLLFNVHPASVGIRDALQPYMPHRSQGKGYLLAGALDKMQGAGTKVQDEKRQFWIALKRLFNI